jgi:SAM-dependent methyltransferase
MRAGPPIFREGKLYPCLYDKDDLSGTGKGAYFHQDILVARKIYEANPRRHVDIGSRIDGFVAHVAVFREIEILDIRPLKSDVHNIKFTQADLSGELPPELVGCCDSLSCLHTIEHFGLGRYGDPIKYTGYLEGLDNMHRILVPGGCFYFSTPIGPQRVEFNAHRIFSVRYLLELLTPRYELLSFAYVTDEGELREGIDLRRPEVQAGIEDNFGCQYGCGIFELRKKAAPRG